MSALTTIEKSDFRKVVDSFALGQEDRCGEIWTDAAKIYVGDVVVVERLSGMHAAKARWSPQDVRVAPLDWYDRRAGEVDRASLFAELACRIFQGNSNLFGVAFDVTIR